MTEDQPMRSATAFAPGEPDPSRPSPHDLGDFAELLQDFASRIGLPGNPFEPEPVYSSQAVGEESVSHPDDTATTLALGEEGGNDGGDVFTSFALGEEGSYGGGDDVTTLALGEEGGGDPWL